MPLVSKRHKNAALKVIEKYEFDYFILGAYHEKDKTIHSFLFFEGKEQKDNIVYDIIHTPCEEVMSGKVCTFENNVNQLFPNDDFFEEYQIKSYVGVSIKDELEQAIGVIVGLKKQPFIKTAELITDFENLELIFSNELVKIQTKTELASFKTKEDELSSLANFGTWEYNLSTGELKWSDQLLKIYGYTEETFDNTINSYYSRLHPSDINDVQELIKNTISDKTSFQIEERIFTTSGEEKVLHSWGAVILNKLDQPEKLFGVCYDITERRIAELKIEQSESKYRHLFENSEVSIWNEDLSDVLNTLDKFRKKGIKDLRQYLKDFPEEVWSIVEQVKVLQVNEATYHMFEAESESAFIESIPATFGEGAIDVFVDSLCAIWNGDSSFKSEANYKTLTGKTFTALLFIKLPIQAEDYKNIPVSIMNITDRKNWEKRLAKSEQKYKDLFEKSSDAILIIQDNIFIDCNQAVLKMLGYEEKTEFLNVHPSVLSPEFQPDGKTSYEKAEEMMQIAVENGTNRFKWMHTRKNGDVFPVEVLLTPVEIDGKMNIHTVWRDITESELALQEIKNTTKRLEKSQEIAKLGSWEVNLNTHELIWSKEHYSIFEIDPNTKKEDLNEAYRSKIHPKDIEELDKQINISISRGQNITYEHRIIGELGIKHVIGIGEVVRDDDGNPIKAIGTVQDITERKFQEQLQQTMLNTMSEGVAIYNENLLPVTYNEQAYKILKLTKGQFEKRDLYSNDWNTHNADGEKLTTDEFPIVQAFRTKKNIQDYVLGIDTGDERMLWINVNADIVQLQNELGEYRDHVFVSFSDITDRIERKKDLELINVAFDAMAEGIVIQDKDGKIIEMNDSACSILGLTREQMSGRDSFDPRWKAITPDGKEFPGENHPGIKSLKTGKTFKNVIMGVHKPNGNLTWISINSSPLFYNKRSKRPDASIATFTDITQKIYNEKGLNLLHTAISQLSNHVMITDHNGFVEYVNPAFEKATGYALKEIMGKRASILKSGVQSNAFYASMWERLTHGKTFQGDITNKTKTGNLIQENLIITPIFNDAGSVSNYVAIYTDLEEKEKAIIAAKKLEEKEILLKEIHHRVKNNLQIVSSLLSLQSSQLNNKDVIDIFKTSQQRVSSIALIHEKLYQSMNLKYIDIRDYISDLVEKIASSVEVKNAVEKELDIDNIDMELDMAVPFGLILNEIITNIYKYAFVGNSESPKFIIKLKKIGQDQLRLYIQDNGVGIEDVEKTVSGGSLGMRLIRSLAKQLHADLEIDSRKGEGLKYVITCRLIND